VDPKVVLWIFTHLDIGRVVDGVVAVEELHRVLFVLMVLDHQTEEPKEMHVRRCEETRVLNHSLARFEHCTQHCKHLRLSICANPSH
jgi:hypothetical protein